MDVLDHKRLTGRRLHWKLYMDAVPENEGTFEVRKVRKLPHRYRLIVDEWGSERYMDEPVMLRLLRYGSTVEITTSFMGRQFCKVWELI